MATQAQNWQPFVLLLIDVQQDFWTAEMADCFPDFCDNVQGLLDLCRDAQIDVVHLRASFAADRSDWMVRYRFQNSIPCIAETEGAEPLSCATALPNEPLFFKQTFDSFLQPQLVNYLAEQQKRFVLVAGLESSVCVLLTAVSAAQRGFLSALVEDCCADKLEAHQHTLNNYTFAFDTIPYADIPMHHDRWEKMLAKLEPPSP
jgi:nicotinamidase-related amidase